jgi:predicted ATPase
VQYRFVGAIHHANARAMRLPSKDNIAAFRTAIAAYQLSGARAGLSVYNGQLAEVSLMAGDVTGAEAALQEAFASVQRDSLAELHRIKGRIALERPEPDRARAEGCFLLAIAVARGQNSPMLELRAATDLARLWRETGSSNDPRALLEPILAAIEGWERSKDARDARALLAEIA